MLPTVQEWLKADGLKETNGDANQVSNLRLEQRHLLLLYAGCKHKSYLERLTPYLERLCVRFFTLAVSNIPLTIWYRTPGRSLTLPPLTKTIECS